MCVFSIIVFVALVVMFHIWTYICSITKIIMMIMLKAWVFTNEQVFFRHIYKCLHTHTHTYTHIHIMQTTSANSHLFFFSHKHNISTKYSYTFNNHLHTYNSNTFKKVFRHIKCYAWLNKRECGKNMKCFFYNFTHLNKETENKQNYRENF